MSFSLKVRRQSMYYFKMKVCLLVSLLSFVKSRDVTVLQKTTVKETLKHVTVKQHKHVEEKILKGYNCGLEEYSHIAVLMGGRRLLCGGSLISEDWILTAAHCCATIKRFSYYSINIGQRVFGQQSGYQQKTNIRQMYIHENHSELPMSSDICVIKTTDRIKISDEVRISKLASTEEFLAMQQGNKCEHAIVMGFGEQRRKEARSLDQRAYNPHIQCAPLKLVKGQDCHDSFNFLTESIFCAADPTGVGYDACAGDSGGPLFCEGVQIGIVSAGFGCGLPGFPGFYCRVDMFTDFIEQAQTGALGNAQTTFGFLSIYVDIIHIIVILFTSFRLSIFC